MIMDKQRQGEQKGHDMEELQASDLAIWGVEKLIFFHQLKMEIQDHGVIALVHTSPTSQRTPQLEFVQLGPAIPPAHTTGSRQWKPRERTQLFMDLTPVRS
jgi:hypothetical protein